MVEAVRTLASPFDIWVIVVVMVALLAFWLSAIMFADHVQARASGHSGDPIGPDQALGAPPSNAGLPGRHARSEIAPEGYEIDESAIEAPTQPDVIFTPPRPTGPARPSAGYAMPAQRSGDADRAERSHAGGYEMPAQRSGDADRAELSHAGPPPSRDNETTRTTRTTKTTRTTRRLGLLGRRRD